MQSEEKKKEKEKTTKQNKTKRRLGFYNIRDWTGFDYVEAKHMAQDSTYWREKYHGENWRTTVEAEDQQRKQWKTKIRWQ